MYAQHVKHLVVVSHVTKIVELSIVRANYFPSTCPKKFYLSRQTSAFRINRADIEIIILMSDGQTSGSFLS